MKKKHNRNRVWIGFRYFLKIFKRKPTYIFLGEEFKDQAIYLSNHVGAQGPLLYELYFPKLFRFWGVHDMNDGFKSRFKYLSTTYFHDKKHMPKWLAFIIAIPATPVMSIFYKGIRLIPTYTDYRLIKSVKMSLNEIDQGNSLIIFPENSSDGYHKVLTQYFPGFYILAKKAYEKGLDLDIYNMYYHRKQKKVVVDKPIKFSELEALNLEKEVIAEMFKDRANELGAMKFE